MLVVYGDSIAANLPWGRYFDGPVCNRAKVGAKIRDLPGQLIDVAGRVVVSIGVNDVTDFPHPLELDGLGPLLEQVPKALVFGPQLCMLWHPKRYRPVLAERLDLVQRCLPGAAYPYLPVWCWRRDGIHLNGFGERRLVRRTRCV